MSSAKIKIIIIIVIIIIIAPLLPMYIFEGPELEPIAQSYCACTVSKIRENFHPWFQVVHKIEPRIEPF